VKNEPSITSHKSDFQLPTIVHKLDAEKSATKPDSPPRRLVFPFVVDGALAPREEGMDVVYVDKVERAALVNDTEQDTFLEPSFKHKKSVATTEEDVSLISLTESLQKRRKRSHAHGKLQQEPEPSVAATNESEGESESESKFVAPEYADQLSSDAEEEAAAAKKETKETENGEEAETEEVEGADPFDSAKFRVPEMKKAQATEEEAKETEGEKGEKKDQNHIKSGKVLSEEEREALFASHSVEPEMTGEETPTEGSAE